MASSTTSQGGYSRPRQNARRQPISRTSTLFGTIRNIVTAPLSWFASTDDFEDTRDSMGKRRRLAAVPTEPALDEEDMAPRTKRMRVESPPRGLRREGAYLDPPPAVFQQPPSIGRSISTGTQTAYHHLAATETTGNYVRSTLSPLRNLSISRTMSIDPPLRPQSREGGAFQNQRPLSVQRDVDSSMESVHAPLPLPASFHRTSHSMPRDLSVPHSRPPFRMRTSLTPQPAQIQRERSEPLPLQLLRTHPTFVKPPPLEEDARAGSTEAGATLGSLVDSVRRTQSPVRQHGSLLFGGKAQPEPKPEMTRAQKALHELDIYKTPLLPTRLRGAQASITGVPDLFKPRRNKLVLIKDEKRKSDRKLGRKEEVSPDKTKPYAGEGGMKKMLAKRKLELEEEEEEEEVGTLGRKTGKVEEKERDETMEEEKVEPQPSAPAEVIPPPPKDDWYSLASGPSATTGGSSLRVGRAKLSRNHISRPTARTKAKFSAAFDDEDEAMQDNDKEKEMLEEAAKKVPVFNIPAGFSFAQDATPIEHDTTKAKEPPIKSLPFSFSDVPTITPVAAPKKAEAPMEAPHAASSAPPTSSLPFSFETSAAATQEKSVPSFGPPSTTQPSEGSGSKEGIPNFFARSAAFSKPLEIKTPPLTFSPQPAEPVLATAPTSITVPVISLTAPSGNDTPSASSGATSLFGSPAPSAPIKDVANPLWEGEQKVAEGSLFKKDQPQVAPISIFGAASQEKRVEAQAAQPSTVTESKADTATASNLFGDFSKAASTMATLPQSSAAAKPPAFTFGPSAPTPTVSVFGAKPTVESGTAAQTPSLFGGGQASTATTTTNASNFTPTTTGSLFDAAPSTDATKPTTSLFGAPPKPTSEAEKPGSLFSSTAPAAPKTTPFSFGQPPASAPLVEAPKPLSTNLFSFGATPNGETRPASPASFAFGASDNKESKPASPAPFSFGNSEKETKAASPAPFGFGATDKETKPASPAPFNFGGPSTPVAAEKAPGAFTFGTPSASPVPLPVFSFGASASTTGDVSQPLPVERPVTPPKNADQEFKMEESPTRELQQTNGSNKPAFGGFTFSNSSTTGSVLFGGPSSAPPTTTTPFPFGSTSSNPFAPPPIKESKSEEPKPFSFSQTSTSTAGTGFSFGQTQPTESPRPSTTGSFNFGSGTPTSTTSGFNFGAPSTSNPFGQSSGGGSAPSSPSTFQSSGFNFGAPSSGTGFTFGSQPASPATGNVNLPQAATPVTFGGTSTGFGSSAPSSPFSAPTQIAPSTSSGGTLFTIGAAPPPQQGQGRPVKKLPNRNRGKR